MGVDELSEVTEQIFVHLAEVDNEVQGILYLMGDTCTKHTQ